MQLLEELATRLWPCQELYHHRREVKVEAGDRGRLHRQLFRESAEI